MDILQNGVQILKRHSISNISDAIRSHIHRDSSTGLGRNRKLFKNGGELDRKHADLESVLTDVIHLFQGKKLQEKEMTLLQERVRNLITTDVKPMLYDFYKDKLMKKGMFIIREKIKHETGSALLTKLGEQWDYFYREVLPTLQALMYPVQTEHNSIRQVALLAFRNTVLLKLPVTEALQNLGDHDTAALPAIQQMLLVLQSVHEVSCTNNYLILEKMVAMVTCPYLGILGLYTGGTEPEIASNFKVPNRQTKFVLCQDDFSGSEEDIDVMDHQIKSDYCDNLAQLPPCTQLYHHKRNSGFVNQLMTAIKEHDRGVHKRRYSIATT